MKSKLGRWIMAVSALALVFAGAGGEPASAAQAPLPVVLVHGVASFAACWDGVPAKTPWVTIPRGKTLLGTTGDRVPIQEGTGWKLFKGTGKVFGSTVPVYVFDYKKNNDGHGDIKGIASDLEQALGYVAKDSGRPKAFIVTHSMGGLVTRETMARTKSARIAGVITLDTPHKGCDFATHWGPSAGLAATLKPASDQMKPGSDFLKGLNSTSIGTTQADKMSGFDVVVGNYYIYWGDGVLSEDEQIPPDGFFAKSDGSFMTPWVTFVNAIHTGDKAVFDVNLGPGLNKGRGAQAVPVVSHEEALKAAREAYDRCVAKQPVYRAPKAAAPPKAKAPPKPAASAEDGDHFAAIDSMSTSRITLDYMTLYRGQEAWDVAAQRGDDASNDYYIVNDNKKLRTFDVSPSVRIVLHPGGLPRVSRIFGLDEFVEMFEGQETRQYAGYTYSTTPMGFFATIENGKLVRLEDFPTP